MVDADPIEQVAFLARSEPRVRILEHLLETGPTAQRDCRECVGASRSTVDRALTALERRDWIAKTGNDYRLTPVGTIVAEAFLELLETIRVTEELSTFLAWFPYDGFDLDPTALSDAEITASTPSEPYAPARKHTEVLGEANRFRGLLPSVGMEGAKVAHERILADELEAELVVSPSVESTIESAEYAPLFREQVATGSLTVLVADGSLPFYLGLIDDGRIQIGVEDDEGFPRAVLDTTTSSARAWGEDVYEEYRTEAHSKPPEEFTS